MLVRSTVFAAWAPRAAVQMGPDMVAVNVDPLTIADEDFERHRDRPMWRGLAVTCIQFSQERGFWRLFRVVNSAKPHGPLWFMPHDNENAGFDSALVGLRNPGSVIVAVYFGVAEERDGTAQHGGRIRMPDRSCAAARPRSCEPRDAGARARPGSAGTKQRTAGRHDRSRDEALHNRPCPACPMTPGTLTSSR